MKSGAVIDDKIIDGLMKSTEVGENCLKDLFEKRIVNNNEARVSLFETISNPKIRTALKKLKTKEVTVFLMGWRL